MDKFPLLPGDGVDVRINGKWHYAVVIEVGCANPEYVLGGPGAKDAGVTRWTQGERKECEAFLHGGHRPVPIRLVKSMWAVLLLAKPLGDNNDGILVNEIVLYTYDITAYTQKELIKKYTKPTYFC